jgi:hypothetical protein
MNRLDILEGSGRSAIYIQIGLRSSARESGAGRMTPETCMRPRVYDTLNDHVSKSSWRVNEWARRVPDDTSRPDDTS